MNGRRDIFPAPVIHLGSGHQSSADQKKTVGSKYLTCRGSTIPRERDVNTKDSYLYCGGGFSLRHSCEKSAERMGYNNVEFDDGGLEGLAWKWPWPSPDLAASWHKSLAQKFAGAGKEFETFTVPHYIEGVLPLDPRPQRAVPSPRISPMGPPQFF